MMVSSIIKASINLYLILQHQGRLNKPPAQPSILSQGAYLLIPYYVLYALKLQC